MVTSLISLYFDSPQISIQQKLFKTLHYWSRDFDFLEKGLRIVSPALFVHDFSTKMFLMLYSTN